MLSWSRANIGYTARANICRADGYCAGTDYQGALWSNLSAFNVLNGIVDTEVDVRQTHRC